MKKYLFFIVMVMTVLGCSLTSRGTPSVDITPTVSNVCFSELNLTDAECENLGTHNYSYSALVEGMFIDCGSDYQGLGNYSISFGGDDTVKLEHPSELIWEKYTHTFKKIGENTYLFSEPLETDSDVNTSWEITFHWWGFQDRLELSYACAAGTCGCNVDIENRLTK